MGVRDGIVSSAAPAKCVGAASFPKSEHLCGKKDIALLMKDGRWGFAGCLKYCWRPREGAGETSASPGEGASKVAGETSAGAAAAPVSRLRVSVPKRLFKRAVKRNLLKRRIREAWRVRKIAGIDLLLQYNSGELCDFAAISSAVESVIAKISSSRG